MSARKSVLFALLDACRHVAAERLEDAAAGVGSKPHAIIAVVALEAAHAYLTVHPEAAEGAGALARDSAQKETPPERMVEVVLSTPMEPVSFTFYPSREHGSN